MSMGGEYILDPSGKLTLRSMIGSYQDENSDGLAWEGNGMQRDFKAVFTERQLMLTWAGNSNQLVFNRRLPSMSGRTDIFIRRGHRWSTVDLMLTNFHLPRTTLLVMIDAFIGSRWRALYQEAISEGYRMLSFGDAMLLDRRAQ